jgi:hypothetical protein
MLYPRIAVHHPRTEEPVLWIVDSEQWPRACLRAELIERGYNPCGFITIDDALDSFARCLSPKPKALILELRGQNLTGQLIEFIHRLEIPTILLGGNPELNDPFIKDHKWNMVFKRPFALGAIADLIEKIVPTNHAKAPLGA